MTLVLPVTGPFPGMGGRDRRRNADWLPGPPIQCSTSTQTTCSGASSGVENKGWREEVGVGCKRPLRRISPLFNTPCQRREEKRKVLRLSVQKLRGVDDPETFLRRSVLINNTLRRLRRELRQDKIAGYSPCPSPPAACSPPPCKRSRPDPPSRPLTPTPAYMQLFDEPQPIHNIERITDDMSDTLVRTVLGLGEDSVKVKPTPMETDAEVKAAVAGLTNSIERKVTSVTESEITFTGYTNSDVKVTGFTDTEVKVAVAGLTESERQIMGEMDAVFTNLLNVLNEA